MRSLLLLILVAALPQDLDGLLEKADKLFEEAKVLYDEARAAGSAQKFIEAGFKLEEVRIKYLVLQEIGTGDKQKAAVDRLRALNQLAKLIHDGKVAVAGTPAEVPPAPPATPEKPADPAVPPAEAPRPAALPTAKMVDVSKRAGVPEASRQKEAEKAVRDLYKEQYAKKTPADRLALSRELLNQARQSQDDLPALWILLRESLDAALQAGNPRAAFEAVDATVQFFDVDPIGIKNAALATLAKTARTLEEAALLADAELRFADDCVAMDQFDLADKACGVAVQFAKKSTDPALLSRATLRAKEVGEAKSKFQSLKRVLETLAKSPADPQANHEMGQFLCFVKANWDLGLCFLAKGSDPVLKPLAEKERAFPADPAERVAIADGWWDLAQKEGSALKKGQLLAHATDLYASVLPATTGLTRVRVQKRLDALRPADQAGPALLGPTTDLLKLIDPKKDALSGDWKVEKDALIIPAGTSTAWLQIPYVPPDEYDLKIVAARKSGTHDLFVGVSAGGRNALLHIDGCPSGNKTGLQISSDRSWEDNETTVRDHKVFVDDKPKVILISVRKTTFTLKADGKEMINWKADYSKFPGEGIIPNPKSLFLGNWETSFEISAIQLATVSGSGKKIAHAR
jgi:hypothetical protein